MNRRQRTFSSSFIVHRVKDDDVETLRARRAADSAPYFRTPGADAARAADARAEVGREVEAQSRSFEEVRGPLRA
jgi:hypothetical protein